jgi:cyclohexanecarboxyl-CoA dehydrogenase
MDFSITNEQELLVQRAKEFALREIRPWVRYISDRGDNDEGINKAREIFKSAAKAGLTGLGYPEEYGGIPADPLTIGMVAETLGRYGGVARLEDNTSLYGATGSGLVISRAGSKQQKETWIPAIIEGRATIGIGSTEPNAGSDLSHLKTSAVRDKDEFIVNGEKQMVSGAEGADAMIVYCRTSGTVGAKGVSAIIVERTNPGVSTYGFKTLGGFFWKLGGIVYNNVRVPVSNLIGQEGQGFYMVMGMFDWMRTMTACQCIGMAQGSLDEAIEYAKQREAFGQPIGKWEAVQFRIAEDATYLEAARWLTYRTLWLSSSAKRFTKEAAMLKWWVPTVAFNVINDCIQNKGAVGFTTSALDELKLRFVRAFWIGDGTQDIQKIVIGREILGREFVPYK